MTQKTITLDRSWIKNIEQPVPPKKEVWINDDSIHCPHCGKNEHVWVENADGDYYEGPEHICTHCGIVFSLPRAHEIAESDPVHYQRLTQFTHMSTTDVIANKFSIAPWQLDDLVYLYERSVSANWSEDASSS